MRGEDQLQKQGQKQILRRWRRMTTKIRAELKIRAEQLKAVVSGGLKAVISNKQ